MTDRNVCEHALLGGRHGSRERAGGKGNFYLIKTQQFVVTGSSDASAERPYMVSCSTAATHKPCHMDDSSEHLTYFSPLGTVFRGATCARTEIVT